MWHGGLLTQRPRTDAIYVDRRFRFVALRPYASITVVNRPWSSKARCSPDESRSVHELVPRTRVMLWPGGGANVPSAGGVGRVHRPAVQANGLRPIRVLERGRRPGAILDQLLGSAGHETGGSTALEAQRRIRRLPASGWCRHRSTRWAVGALHPGLGGIREPTLRADHPGSAWRQRRLPRWRLHRGRRVTGGRRVVPSCRGASGLVWPNPRATWRHRIVGHGPPRSHQ
jgi:hypothetical protein